MLQVRLPAYLRSSPTKAIIPTSLYPDRDLASSRARNVVVNPDKLHQELKAKIDKAQCHYQGPAFVKAKFLWTT